MGTKIFELRKDGESMGLLKTDMDSSKINENWSYFSKNKSGYIEDFVDYMNEKYTFSFERFFIDEIIDV